MDDDGNNDRDCDFHSLQCGYKGGQAFRKIVDSQSNSGELTDSHQFGRIVYGLSVGASMKSATMIMTMGSDDRF